MRNPQAVFRATWPPGLLRRAGVETTEDGVVRPDVCHGGPGLSLPRLCSLLGVAIELPEFPLSFSVAIRRMGSFVLVDWPILCRVRFTSGVPALRACEWNSCASLSNSSLRDMVALLP
jgi:hypothetical protein